MAIFFSLFSIFMLGLIGGAVPGPILTSLFAEVLREGFAKTIMVILKASIAESVMAFLVIIAFSVIKIPEVFFYALSFIGVFVLASLAREVWRIKTLNTKGEIFTLRKFFTIVAFSGPFWIFWITICVPQAFLLSQKIIGGQFVFLILFEIGWWVSTFCLVFLFSRFRNLLIRSNLTYKIFKILALILVFFALKLLYDGVAHLVLFF